MDELFRPGRAGHQPSSVHDTGMGSRQDDMMAASKLAPTVAVDSWNGRCPYKLGIKQPSAVTRYATSAVDVAPTSHSCCCSTQGVLENLHGCAREHCMGVVTNMHGCARQHCMGVLTNMQLLPGSMDKLCMHMRCRRGRAVHGCKAGLGRQCMDARQGWAGQCMDARHGCARHGRAHQPSSVHDMGMDARQYDMMAASKLAPTVAVESWDGLMSIQ